MTELKQNIDTLVIGGGQAGLVMGYYLSKAGISYQIIESNSRIGDSWRKRYDSLVLFTPRSHSALPGLNVPGEKDGYPTKDEIADYLEDYANHFGLPIILETCIISLKQSDSGGFVAIADFGNEIYCHSVIIATGAFQLPNIPKIARNFSKDVLQFSTEGYKRPDQIPSGTVLVVGDGATGRQIALELAKNNHQVILACGRKKFLVPDRILGKSIFWWMEKLGLLTASKDTIIGKRIMRNDSFPARGLDSKRLKKSGVIISSRLIEVNGHEVSFSDVQTAEVDSVVWATGYRDDTDWIKIQEVKDEKGNFIHQRGISPVRGLYFIGRDWQWTVGSALLLGVGADASFLVSHIERTVKATSHSNL
jgi:putative flavoprotein involved in K+ transport